MHNMTSRPQNLADAYKVVEKKFGDEYAGYLGFSSYKILENGTVPVAQLPKLSFIKKMIL